MMELIAQRAFVFIFACNSTLRLRSVGTELSAAVPSAVGKILGSNYKTSSGTYYPF